MGILRDKLVFGKMISRAQCAKVRLMDAKSCKTCGQKFEVRAVDREFLEKMQVPQPTLCPDCRAQRRLAFRNQRNLYHRKCDFTGENMISLYSPDKPYKVYKEEVWWSDQWDPMDYGRDFDFTRPFFEQFKELLLAVPRRGMHQDGTNENSKYISYGSSNKNCYLAFTCFYSEDTYYSTMVGFSKDCMDSYFCGESQLLYECVDTGKSYMSAYLTNCAECQNSYFLDDCRACKNCIGCKNLRNKEYHIFNKPVSPEEFETFKAEMLRGDLDAFKTEFDAWKLSQPFLYARIKNSENCTGDHIENAKDCHHSFELVLGAENCNYCQAAGWKGKDLFDCSRAGKESELLYEMHATVTSHRSAFGNFCGGVSDSYYIDSVDMLDHCFGAVGLRHKQYCILNKQYTKEEYEALLPKIIAHMKATGEWGEFLPPSMSPFAFNETLAAEYYPLSREEVLKRGWKWKELEAKGKVATTDSLSCATCTQPYKVVPQEAEFYKKMGLPTPKNCHECRHTRRMRSTNPYHLWTRNCAQCGVEFQSSYSPGRTEILYCEACYLKTVY